MEDQDFQARFNELATRYVTENVKIWQRYAQTVSRLSGREGRGENLQGQLADFALHEGGEFIRNLMQLSLNYYSVLLDMSVGFTNRMLDQALQTPPEKAPPPPPAESRPASSTRFELNFSGQQGQTPSSPFVVENKKEEPVTVSFEITEFISEDGTMRFRAPVEFIPDQVTLEPGAEQVVQCRVQLEPDFVPGRRYMALVRVTGFPGMEIGLIVTPQPVEGKEGQPAEPKSQESPSPGEAEAEA